MYEVEWSGGLNFVRLSAEGSSFPCPKTSRVLGRDAIENKSNSGKSRKSMLLTGLDSGRSICE